MDKPELGDHLQGVWRAYQRLNTSRRYEQGKPLFIPYEVVDMYCKRFGPYDIDGFERFLTLIEAMDAEYLRSVRT